MFYFCLFINLSVQLSILMPTYLQYLTLYLYFSIYLYLSVHLSIFLFISLSLLIPINTYPFIYQTNYLSLYLSIYTLTKRERERENIHISLIASSPSTFSFSLHFSLFFFFFFTTEVSGCFFVPRSFNGNPTPGEKNENKIYEMGSRVKKIFGEIYFDLYSIS